MHSQWQSPPPKNQQPQLQPPPQTTTTITRSSNKFQIQNLKKKKKKNSKSSTKPQPNRSINDQTQQLSAAKAVEDDEQRSATAPGRAKLQIGEQRFRLASFNRRALLQIRISFFFVTRSKDRRLWRTTSKDRRLPLGE